ncbi:MAG: 1-aminocyclopropane-1-carboxylate deaminase/D-cysteine desulfhydrase [Flavobacteriales bacterium]|nr:1-aminocyclopropane-1-carboxylate deaminase/D-cysteine desulfhydrase [Flavobacteriales bacterium]
MLQIPENIPVVEIHDDRLRRKNSRLHILREDLIHPEISGNKWRKLRYNLEEAKQQGHDTMLTFGGAYSNHIAATAAAGHQLGFKTIGIIRGEEALPLNPTLKLAAGYGMQLNYCSREKYREKHTVSFREELKENYGDFYLIPEGGSNHLAVKGCVEILDNINADYDLLCCACGTGATAAGLIAASKAEFLGFPALKNGGFLNDEITTLLDAFEQAEKLTLTPKPWKLQLDYHLGGYAKINRQLVDFVREFHTLHQVPLDLIYTGKMLYGIFNLLQYTAELDNRSILVIHTGGLQGNKGFEERLGVVL